MVSADAPQRPGSAFARFNPESAAAASIWLRFDQMPACNSG